MPAGLVDQWPQLDEVYSPRSVCRVYSSGPIGVNPIPAADPGVLLDNNSVPLDNGAGILLLAR